MDDNFHQISSESIIAVYVIYIYAQGQKHADTSF